MDEWSTMSQGGWEQLRVPAQFTHEEVADLFYCRGIVSEPLVGLDNPLPSSPMKPLAEGFRALLVGLSISLAIATYQTSPEQSSHERKRETEIEAERDRQRDGERESYIFCYLTSESLTINSTLFYPLDARP